MKREKHSWLTIIAKKLLINKNRLSPFMQILAECLQFLLYLPIIFNLSVMNDLLSNFSEPQLSIWLLIMILTLIKIFRQISLTKFVYVIVLNFLVQSLQTSLDASNIYLLIMLVILVVIDLISNISFDFYSENLGAENLNFIKIINPLVICFGVIHSNIWPNSVAFQAFSIGAFLVLFMLKRSSMAKSSNFKQLLLRFYLWAIFCHIVIMVKVWIKVRTLIQLLVPLAVSQFIYYLYSINKSQIKLNELISQEKYLKSAFQVCKYLHGNEYSIKMQTEINNFLGESLRQFLKPLQKRALVYEKLCELLAKKNSFQSLLISAQIYLFWNHQLLKSKNIIQSLKLKLRWFSFMKRILVYRVQQALLSLYLLKNSQIHFLHYQCYYQCDQFRSLLLKTSIAYINVWQYTRKPQILPQRLRQLSNKLVYLQNQVNRSFDEIEVKCVTLSLLYVSYIFEVARDITKGNKILQALSFNEDFQLNFELDQKVFLRLSLEETHLKISKIGHNVSSLLGFSRKQLQGHKSQIFIPQFYRKYHKQYAQRLLEQKFQILYLYSKKTLIKNKWNYYEECNIILRLHYDIGQQLRLEGYIQIKKNNNYCWNDFIYVAQNQDIMECSQNLSDLMPTTTKVHKITQYFQPVASLQQPQFHKSQQDCIQYRPLVTYIVQKQKVIYFVRYVQISQISQQQQPHQQITHMLKSMNLLHLDWQFIKEYYLKLKVSLDSVFSKEYLVLFALSLIFIAGIFACQSQFLASKNSKGENREYVINTCSQVVRFYNISLKLGMDVCYIDLNQQYGYSNNFTRFDLVKQSLALQTINQQLKRFVNNTFILPSLLPNLIYNKALYDIVQQFLSNAYMLQKFSDDPFVLNSSMTRIRMSLQTLFVRALNDYKVSLLNSIVGIQSNNQAIDIIALVVIILLLFFLYMLIVRLQYKLRADQNEIFNVLGCIRDQQQLIDSTKRFISKITTQQINYKKLEFQDVRLIKKYDPTIIVDVNASAREQASVSQMSIRQMSGRNLMDESLNRSSILPGSQTSRNQGQPQVPSVAHHSFEIRQSNRNKFILIGPVIFFIIIMGLSIGNHVKNNIIDDIDEVKSANNIFDLYKQSSYYSKLTIGLLNLLNLRATNSQVDTSAFDNYFPSFDKFQLIVTFRQSTFPQFASFQNYLTQVQYQYMCNYIRCDSRFANQINIIYTTTIQKMRQNILALEATLNYSNSLFQSSINSNSIRYQIDLLFYTQAVIRNYLTNIFTVYLQCVDKYTTNLEMSKSLFIVSIFLITVLGVIAYIILLFYVCRNQWYLNKIGQLIKTDNYINDQNHFMDKQNIKTVPPANQ